MLSQRFLLNFNVTRSSIGALSHQALQRWCGCCSGTHQKLFIVLLESRIFFVFGYLGVRGNLRRQQKTSIFFCAFGVWGNLWNHSLFSHSYFQFHKIFLVVAEECKCVKRNSNSNRSWDGNMRIDQTTLPVSFKLLSASTVLTCSDKLGAVRGDFIVPRSSNAVYYFEISIEKVGTSEDSTYFCIGAITTKFFNNQYPGSRKNSFGYSSNGHLYHNGDVVDYNSRFVGRSNSSFDTLIINVDYDVRLYQCAV